MAVITPRIFPPPWGLAIFWRINDCVAACSPARIRAGHALPLVLRLAMRRFVGLDHGRGASMDSSYRDRHVFSLIAGHDDRIQNGLLLACACYGWGPSGPDVALIRTG